MKSLRNNCNFIPSLLHTHIQSLNFHKTVSKYFSEASYERDVQHEILGLPTRSRLKRGALPDQNLPNDFLNEEAQPESAIDILLAVGLVPANKNNSNNGGLPEE